MSIFEEIESLKYRFVLDLIKSEEQYNKDKSVYDANKAFELFYKRYNLMQEVLNPLKEALGENVDVTDISFNNGMPDETHIVINYVKEDKSYLLALSNIGFIDIGIVSSDVVARQEDFVAKNKGKIIRTFRNIRENGLEDEITVKSTTGKFSIKDNCDSFIISDAEGKVFKLEGKYSNYKKTGLLYEPTKLVCNYPKLKELLLEDDNALAIYQHTMFYEEDFPKELIKKLTNS